MPLPTFHARPGTRDMRMLGGARTICSELREVNSNEAGARWGHHTGQAPETQSRARRGRFGEQLVLACSLGWLLNIQSWALLPTTFFWDLPSSSGEETTQPHFFPTLKISPAYWLSFTGMRISLRLKGWGGAEDGEESFISQCPLAWKTYSAFIKLGFVLGTFTCFLFYITIKKDEGFRSE